MGATDKVLESIGFITENRGTGTIANEATTAAIIHGLGYTPNASDIWITFAENPTNMAGLSFITNVTSTQFTVNVENDPKHQG
jgi:hypothetical protein